MRHVIVHHHIFKNAGTSVDALLGDMLGELWWLFDPVETHGHAGLGRIEEIEAALGAALFDRLLSANAFDLCLYHKATRLFEAARARRQVPAQAAFASETLAAAAR